MFLSTFWSSTLKNDFEHCWTLLLKLSPHESFHHLQYIFVNSLSEVLCQIKISNYWSDFDSAIFLGLVGTGTSSTSDKWDLDVKLLGTKFLPLKWWVWCSSNFMTNKSVWGPLLIFPGWLCSCSNALPTTHPPLPIQMAVNQIYFQTEQICCQNKKIFVKFIKEIFFQEKQEISLGRSCSTHSDPHPCQSNLLQAKSLVNNLPIPINHLLHLLLFLQSANQTLGVSICISVRKQTQANSVQIEEWFGQHDQTIMRREETTNKPN